MQSEILYRRYLKKGDVFVHADLKGATPIIVKNRQGSANAPIPPSTLSQAGNLCVATSSAWDSKAVMSAWWVPAIQVSKTTVGGLLPPGDFSIKGDKNFLAPSQLILGFAVMFQISRESLRNHKTRQFYEPAEAAGEEIEAPVEGGKEPEDQEETEKATPAQDMDGEQESGSESGDGNGPPMENAVQPGTGESAQEDDTSQAGEDALVGNQENKDQDKGLTAPFSEEAPDEQGANGTEDPEDIQTPQETELSIRERRSLRQGKSQDPAVDNGSLTPTPPKPALPTRGKKGRSKKAATKYAEQDEEDRELALHLVGAKSAKVQKAAAASEAKANREKEAQAQKDRRRAQHERAVQAERKRQVALNEGDDDYDEETAAAEAAALAWIPVLIGTPHPDDEILAAIPVCAPWAALGRYKYRVKLQPGAVKKGKAVKEIHGRWVAETTTGKVRKEQAEEAGIDRAAAEKLRAREGELIKGWKDSEIVNTLPVGKVRVMLPGGEAKGKPKGGGAGGKGGGKGGKGGKKK